MGRLLCQESESVELPSGLRALLVLSFWHRCLLEFALHVRPGW